jgi:hypothetical protein
VCRSTEIDRYTPGSNSGEWDELKEKFLGIVEASRTVDNLEGG